MKNDLRRLAALSIVLLSAVSSTASAHPFHITHAEAEYNAETRRLEVALRVYQPADLEAALGRQAGTKVDLEQTEAIDEVIRDYLAKALVVVPAGQTEPAEIVWVGKEVSVKTVWLYFEIPLPGEPEGARVTNKLLVEIEPDQVNTLNVRHGRRRATVRTTRDRPTQSLAFTTFPATPRDDRSR